MTDIRGPLNEICDRLGFEPHHVRTLTIEPAEVVATVYRLNDNGQKFVEDGKPAVETYVFKVRT